jgi:hypothetical protein
MTPYGTLREIVDTHTENKLSWSQLKASIRSAFDDVEYNDKWQGYGRQMRIKINDATYVLLDNEGSDFILA